MKNIMIVEDEVLVRVGLRSFLDWESYGFRICGEASNGIEALEKIPETCPDILLTDLKMSGMDGFELIRICREKYPQIHFVVLSSYNDFDNVREAMKLGADDYIFKLSSSPEVLLKTLREVSEKIDTMAIKEAAQSKREMNEFVEKNTSALKRNFIRDAIRGSVVNSSEYIDDFSKILKLQVSFDVSYRLMYLSIDGYDKLQMEASENGILRSSVENIILNAIEDQKQMELFGYERGDFVLILQEDEKKVYGESDIKDIFEKINRYVSRYAGITMTGYVSMSCVGLECLREVVSHMQRKLYKRMSWENGHLNFYVDQMRGEIAYIDRYIHDHLDKELTVSAVAAVANMSESYFSHVFKKEMGQSFTNYVNQVRISQAKELLLNSDLKINEIASEVGLENSNYFSTLFKKMTGESPNQFRSRVDK